MTLSYAADRLTFVHQSTFHRHDFAQDDFGNLHPVHWNCYLGAGTDDFYLSEQELGFPCISSQQPH